MLSDVVDEAWLTVDVLVHPKGVVWGPHRTGKPFQRVPVCRI